jgi:hypothetical protein
VSPGRIAVVVVVLVAGGGAWYVASELRRARRGRTEAPNIGDTRTIIAVQDAYASANGGLYAGSLECLHAPSRCIPGYAPDAPSFLDRELATAPTRSGYARRFVAGPRASPEEIARREAGPDSVTCWAYLSTPLSSDRGARSFCGDCTGAICVRLDGGPPLVRDGACTECDPLR